MNDQSGAIGFSQGSRRTFLRLLGLGAAGSLLAACTPAAPAAQPTSPPAAPAKPTAAPKPAAPAATTAPAPTMAPAVASPVAAAPQPSAAPAVDMAAIEAAAKREGAVVVYSSFNLDEFDKIYPLFEKRYAGIKVDHVRANGEQLINRMVTEAKGGKVIADVLETNSFEVFNAISANLMEPFKAPNAEPFPAGLKQRDGVWTSTRQNVDIVAWNTNLVQPADAPKSYDDLADPKWKGKIMVEVAEGEMYAGLVANKFGGSLETANAWLTKVAANEPQGFTGHTQITELLAAGQSAIFLGAYAHRVEALKLDKAPVEWMKTEGAQLLQVGGVVKGAPNPNAARLFFNWLLGEEGQIAISQIGRIPSRPGVKLSVDFFSFGTKWYPAQPELAKDQDAYTKAWQSTLNVS